MVPINLPVTADVAAARVDMSKVDHPSHYNKGKIEVIDAVEDWELNFSLGNTVKYIARNGRKEDVSALKDLRKAKWYLDREISRRDGTLVTTTEKLVREKAKTDGCASRSFTDNVQLPDDTPRVVQRPTGEY